MIERVRPPSPSRTVISTRHKFIFVHIPKTGGNAISVALAPFVDDEVRLTRAVGEAVGDQGDQGVAVTNEALGLSRDGRPRKHAPLRLYAERLGDAFSGYYVFAVLRNPLDRLVSRMAFNRDARLAKPIAPQDMLFPKPHLTYLTVEGRVAVTRLIRFECLAADFSRVCAEIGIDPAPLEPRNRSAHDPFEEYFTDETRALVAERYRCDGILRAYTFAAARDREGLAS